MTILWKWNELDTTEFGSAIPLMSQITGTCAFEYVPAWATSSVFEPSLRLDYTRFHISGGLIGAAYSASTVIQINPGMVLPKRYTLCFNVQYMSGADTSRFGVVFGALSGSGGIYGTVGTDSTFGRTGGSGRFRAIRANFVSPEQNYAGNFLAPGSSSLTVNRYQFELNSITCSISGNTWRAYRHTYKNALAADNPGGRGYTFKKEVAVISNIYGDWTGQPNATSIFFWVQNPITSSLVPGTNSIQISNLYIEKHPLDE